jgi:hypothetical protein
MRGQESWLHKLPLQFSDELFNPNPFFRKVNMPITAKLVIAALTMSLSAATGADEPIRLRLRDGTGPVEVQFVAWDFQTQRLMVQLADGSRRELAPTDLQDSDRRAVTKLLQRQIAGRDQPADSQPEATSSGSLTPFTGPGTTRDLNLHGTHWLADRDAALQLARGDESPADDRPVLWFRVLGNLSGFM